MNKYDSHLLVGMIANLLWEEPVITEISFRMNKDSIMIIEAHFGEENKYLRWALSKTEMETDKQFGYEGYARFIVENIMLKIKGG